jgi:hypothetical protein
VSNRRGPEQVSPQRGRDLVVRFGGAMTGVGIAAGLLYLLGLDRAVTPYLVVPLLLVGVALLVAGSRGRHRRTR